jgi:hypothetical protein
VNLDIHKKPSTADEVVTRRRLLGRGAKLAYVTPLIISAMSADPAFASVSGGGDGGSGGDDGGGGAATPDGRSHGYYAHNGQSFVPSTLVLGTVTYSHADLISILKYGGPDFLPKLAYQLITAEVNAQYFTVPATVQTAFTFANALIGSLNIIPLGKNSLSPSASTTISGTTMTASDADSILDGFNSP